VQTEATQDYLKQIYMLQSSEGRATTSAIAERMGVSAASATAMIKRLAELGLVEHAPYHGASLTPEGERVAVEVLRHHRLIELYLTERLGLPWDQVHAEAERLEHHISEDLEAAFDEALGFPATDPHGDPIPSPDLVLPPDVDSPLSTLEPGQRGVVRRVPDGDPALLQYLGTLGLVPNATFLLVEKAPFEGPVTIDIDGAHHALGLPVASRIRVAVAA